MGRILDISEVLLELGLSSSVTDEERALAVVAVSRAEGAVRRYLRYDPVQASRTEFYPRRSFQARGGDYLWDADDTQAYIRHVAKAATNEIQVQHIPVRSSPAIGLYIDYDGRFGTASGAFGSESQKTEGTDFWPVYDGQDDAGNALCRSGILRSIGQWPTTPGTVKIVYTAGYTADEFRGQDTLVDAVPVWEVALDEAVRRVKQALVRKKNALAGHLAGLITSERLGDYSYSLDATVARQLFGGEYDLQPSSREKLDDFVNLGYVLSG